jgi:hypothetical protein
LTLGALVKTIQTEKMTILALMRIIQNAAAEITHKIGDRLAHKPGQRITFGTRHCK